jgi:Holliday junction resolvasome RuvABC DNA-binding subunit
LTRKPLTADRIEPSATSSAAGGTRTDLVSALVNLGYQRPAAEKALSSVDKNGPFDAMFRAALAVMAK